MLLGGARTSGESGGQALLCSDGAGSEVGDELEFPEQRVPLTFPSVRKHRPCFLVEQLLFGREVLAILVSAVLRYFCLLLHTKSLGRKLLLGGLPAAR